MSLIPLGFFSGQQSLPSYMPSNGLVLHLDAGNTLSYPGSGNTWYNLANSNFTTTLVPTVNNPMVYDSSNGGSILFKVSGDYGYTSDYANVTSTLANRQTWNSYWSSSNKMTILTIVKGVTTGFIRLRDAIIGQYYFVGLGFGWHIHCNFNVHRGLFSYEMPYSTSQNNFGLLGDAFNTPPSNGPVWEDFNNQVIFVGMTHDGTTTNINYWLNNNFYTSNSIYTTPVGTYMTDDVNNVQIGIFGGGGQYRTKNIYQIAIWNRVLSNSEITSIYNGYKSRHGYA